MANITNDEMSALIVLLRRFIKQADRETKGIFASPDDNRTRRVWHMRGAAGWFRDAVSDLESAVRQHHV